MFSKIFCWLYFQWIARAIGSKNAPLVKALDLLFGSECKYCMSTRAFIAGFGAGLLFVGSFLSFFSGMGLIALAVALTLGERYWLCKKEDHEQNSDQG